MRSSVSLSYRSLQQDRDDGLNIEALQVSVGLSRTHKHDGLACDVRHGDGRPHLQAGRERGSIIHVYSRGGESALYRQGGERPKQAGRERGSIIHVYSRERERLYIGRGGEAQAGRERERGKCSGVPCRRRCQTW